MSLNPLAEAANAVLAAEAPVALAALSQVGAALYFPTKGILAQSAEAAKQATNHNATIGIALEPGGPMRLAAIDQHFSNLKPADIYPYAPSPGKPALREAWLAKIRRDTPSLGQTTVSLPIVTNALTHGLAVAGELFLDRGDEVLIADQYWENYDLCWGVRLGAAICTYPFFTADLGGLDLGAFRAALAARAGKKALVVLNFPNNPTGYTCTKPEATAIVAALTEAAAAGTRLVVVCDDAYYGMFYDDVCETESLFGRLAQAHPNLIALKIDGPTKEMFVWGLRVGFITVGWQGASAKALKAIEDKIGGCIRGSLSNITHPGQSAVLQGLADPGFAAQQQAKVAILRGRYQAVAAAARDPQYADCWQVYPFNSGYFMLIRTIGIEAEPVRQHLLAHEGVGLITAGKHDLRVAFSCVEEAKIADLFARIARGLRAVRG